MRLQHKPCDVMSCMSMGLGWGGLGLGGVGWSCNTDHLTCCPVCLWDWVGVGLQHRSCDVLSCMSVGLGGVG